ncbi:MAG: metallophosphoesterase, partial [Limisphaerales bacterium]
MPIHLGTGDRRAFLQGLAVGAVAITAPAQGAEIDDDLVYLLNDIHIGEKHPPNPPVPSNFREVANEILGLKRQPAAVLINGDLALKDGQPGDYVHFEKLLRPLRQDRVNLHLTLGNHDHRDTFYRVLNEENPDDSPVASRHVSV